MLTKVSRYGMMRSNYWNVLPDFVRCSRIFCEMFSYILASPIYYNYFYNYFYRGIYKYILGNDISYSMFYYIIQDRRRVFPMNNYKKENLLLDEIASTYICVVNSQVRHSRSLTPHAKLVCIELIGLADDWKIYDDDNVLSYLTSFTEPTIRSSLEVLEENNFISISYIGDQRVITLKEKAQ